MYTDRLLVVGVLLLIWPEHAGTYLMRSSSLDILQSMAENSQEPPLLGPVFIVRCASGRGDPVLIRPGTDVRAIFRPWLWAFPGQL